MPASLSIKNVPEEIVTRLKERAARHHRSLQGELLALLEEAVKPHRKCVRDLRKEISELGLQTPGEALDMIRETRDGR